MTDNNNNNDDLDLELLAETDAFAILRGKDVSGEDIYNIELGTVTLHLFLDEWQELLSLIEQAAKK